MGVHFFYIDIITIRRLLLGRLFGNKNSILTLGSCSANYNEVCGRQKRETEI